MASPHLRILILGDLIGTPGRALVRRLLPALRKQYRADLVIANGENSFEGRGITVATAEDMLAAGVDVITTGNHRPPAQLSGGRARAGLVDGADRR